MATAPKIPGTPVYEDQLVAIHNQRLWWLLIGSAVIIVALTTALTIIALKPHNIPYVVEVDPRGQPVGTILPFAGQQAISENTIRWVLGEYIRQAFTISRNFNENKMTLTHVYSLSTGQASEKLTAYYRANHDANNPLTLSGQCWQDVKIIRTLKLPAPDTYQVDFVVGRHDHDHPQDGLQTSWRATLRMLQGLPTAKNALGVWITDLDFGQEEK